MNTLHCRIARLEHLQGEQGREPGQPWWWELPEDQWHLGAIGISHEDAIALPDAEGDAEDEAGGERA